jgi:leucine-rich repeats and immunoglobulin-like domains protein 2
VVIIKDLRYLQNNTLSAINPGTFKDMNYLKELWLNFNQITTIDSTAFSGLYSLQALRLGFNKLTKIEGDLFKDMSSLQVLSLNYNIISYFNKTSLAGLYLQKLCLYNNPIASNSLTAGLCNANPGCTVITNSPSC